MNNKEVITTNNNTINTNNSDLTDILDTINTLPAAGGGGAPTKTYLFGGYSSSSYAAVEKGFFELGKQYKLTFTFSDKSQYSHTTTLSTSMSGIIYHTETITTSKGSILCTIVDCEAAGASSPIPCDIILFQQAPTSMYFFFVEKA